MSVEKLTAAEIVMLASGAPVDPGEGRAVPTRLLELPQGRWVKVAGIGDRCVFVEYLDAPAPSQS